MRQVLTDYNIRMSSASDTVLPVRSTLDMLNPDIDISDLLTRWENFAEEQSCMHVTAMRHYRLLNYIMVIPAIIISTIGGAGNISLSSIGQCPSNTWQIVFGSMSVVSASMFTIQKFLGLTELQEIHTFYSSMFFKLSNEIRLHMTIAKSEQKTYTSLAEFAKEIKKNIDVCLEKAPILSKRIMLNEEKKRGRLTVICSTHASEQGGGGSQV